MKDTIIIWYDTYNLKTLTMLLYIVYDYSNNYDFILLFSDDKLIAKFLHCCDNSLERTKSTIDLFFCLRADAPEFFTDRDPEDQKIQNILKLM